MSSETAHRRIQRVVDACAEDHFILDLNEFRHFVRLQLCFSSLVLLQPRDHMGDRSLTMRDIIGRLLAAVHVSLEEDIMVRDSIVEECSIELPSEISDTAINRLTYWYRKGLDDQFCIGAILNVLLLYIMRKRQQLNRLRILF